MTVRVNNKIVGSTTVSTTSWQDFFFAVPGDTDPTTAKVDILYDNDASSRRGGDRNLYVQGVAGGGVVLPATEAIVDEGTTWAAATDGRNTYKPDAGGGIYRNGAMRWRS